MNEVTNLLILYAGIILINTLLSISLWLREKANLYFSLFLVWLGTLVAFLAQGILINNHFLIAIGFSFCFLMGISLSNLIKTIVPIVVPWKLFIYSQLLSYFLAFFAYYYKLSFIIITFPIAISAVFPLLFSVYLATKKYWNQLTFSGKGLLITCILISIHTLDYPFLRLKVEFSTIGFTLACLNVFALSIFTFAAVLESITKEKTRVLAEVDVAHRIQMEILPKNPVIPGLELACYMKPADEVGGDYYDVFSVGDYSWIMLGDVTGHGLGSGLVMFMVQSIMSSILHTKKDISPKELNFIANKILFQNLERLNEKRPMTIVTLCVKKDYEMVLSGSHDNIYIYRADSKSVEIINLDHFPIGIGFTDQLEKSFFLEDKFKLKPNDVLFIGTDGITEAMKANSKSEEYFGEERLISIIKENAHTSVNNLKGTLVTKLDEFTHNHYIDDLTFIIAKVNP